MPLWFTSICIFLATDAVLRLDFSPESRVMNGDIIIVELCPRELWQVRTLLMFPARVAWLVSLKKMLAPSLALQVLENIHEVRKLEFFKCADERFNYDVLG